MNMTTRLTNRWVRLPLTLVLILLSAFCFLDYLDWAFVYSGRLGLADRIETQMAGNRSLFFFFLFVGLEILCATVVGMAWEPPLLGSAPLRFVARYGTALALSLLVTGIVTAAAVALLLGTS